MKVPPVPEFSFKPFGGKSIEKTEPKSQFDFSIHKNDDIPEENEPGQFYRPPPEDDKDDKKEETKKKDDGVFSFSSAKDSKPMPKFDFSGFG